MRCKTLGGHPVAPGSRCLGHGAGEAGTGQGRVKCPDRDAPSGPRVLVYRITVGVCWEPPDAPLAVRLAKIRPMTYETLFDAASAPADSTVLVGGAILAVMGLVLLRLDTESALVRQTPFRGRPVAWRVFRVAWLLIALAVVIGESWSRLAPRGAGEAMVVEGLVEDFVPASASGPNFESLTVIGVRFRYSDGYHRRGFHQTSMAGGPMRAGLMVRIHYVGPADDPTIVRLEARR